MMNIDEVITFLNNLKKGRNEIVIEDYINKAKIYERYGDIPYVEYRDNDEVFSNVIKVYYRIRFRMVIELYDNDLKFEIRDFEITESILEPREGTAELVERERIKYKGRTIGFKDTYRIVREVNGKTVENKVKLGYDIRSGPSRESF
jgi:hypothetical protein